MTQTPARPARRLATPRWRDGRLLIGVLLVLVSTSLGAWLLARAGDTEPVYAAKVEIAPGQLLTADDLSVVDVRLGEGVAGYLSATSAVPAQSYALAPVHPGELVTLSAVGNAEQVTTRAVTIGVEATSAGQLRRGSVVDVWVNRLKEGTNLGRPVYAGPEQLLTSMTVARVAEENRSLGASGQRTVAILVPAGEVAKIVGDVDAGARITLVPAPGGLTGGDQ